MEDIGLDDLTQDDLLPDDDCVSQTSQAGPANSSPWNEWHPDAMNPLLLILVMAHGRKTYTAKDHNDKSTR